jgi:hypothetical protein
MATYQPSDVAERPVRSVRPVVDVSDHARDPFLKARLHLALEVVADCLQPQDVVLLQRHIPAVLDRLGSQVLFPSYPLNLSPSDPRDPSGRHDE